MKTYAVRFASPLPQRGVSLIFALIALVAMSLAALALVRTVDTATLVAGNLAFRQAATTSADSGVETGITALTALQAANVAKNVFADATHAMNITSAPANGYYSNMDPALNFATAGTWVTGVSSAEVVDASGNRVRYIIQRMCRHPNEVLSVQNCQFTGAQEDNGGKQVPLPSDVCDGPGCPKGGQAPLYRVTVRVAGPKNTLSYVQALVH